MTKHSRGTGDQARVGEQVVLERIGPSDRSTRISESSVGQPQRRRWAEESSTGVEYGGVGRGPQKEENTQGAAEIAFATLHPGAAVRNRTEPEHDSADWIYEREGGALCRMQVQRVPIERAYRASLAQQGARVSLSVADAAVALEAAAIAKANKKYADQAQLVLVLDASDAPALVSREVALAYRSRSTSPAHGFQAVVVVDQYTQRCEVLAKA